MFKVLLSLFFISFLKAEHFAVLVAGSNGYWNYRHQADICHAYQVTFYDSRFSSPKE